MKNTNTLLNSLFYFFYFFGSCIIVMLAEALLIFIVEKFVALPYPILTFIRIVIYTAGVPAILAALGYFEGYREGVASTGSTVVSGIAASVLHLLFAMLFKFQGFAAGGVRFAAGLLYNGWDVTYDSLINETPYALFLMIFVLYAALYTAVLGVSKHIGAKKRQTDRSELIRDPSAE